MGDSLKQEQRGGDDSTNIQAPSITILHGLTVSEARQIALDVFKANALELAGLARELFEARGREFIDHYLDELRRRKPEAIESFRDADMQYAVYTAQRDYARTGSESLAKILIDLLIQRSTAADLPLIVLNEAVAIAAKLTENQLDLLSFVLLFVHSAPLRYSFTTLEEFRQYLATNIVPFLNGDYTRFSAYLHLKYTGCISMDSGGQPIIAHIELVFRSCLTQGFGFRLKSLRLQSTFRIS